MGKEEERDGWQCTLTFLESDLLGNGWDLGNLFLQEAALHVTRIGQSSPCSIFQGRVRLDQSLPKLAHLLIIAPTIQVWIRI